jgi:hypothetical protein
MRFGLRFATAVALTTVLSASSAEIGRRNAFQRQLAADGTAGKFAMFPRGASNEGGGDVGYREQRGDSYCIAYSTSHAIARLSMAAQEEPFFGLNVPECS